MDPKDQPTKSAKSLKKVTVIQRGTSVYYPQTIPRERGTLTTFLFILLTVVIVLADVLSNENKVSTVLGFYVTCFLLYFCYELLYRTILLTEEIKHLTSRYEKSFKTLFNAAFSFSTPTRFFVSFSLLYIVAFLCLNGVQVFPTLTAYRTLFCIWPTTFLLRNILDMSSCSLNDSLWIAKDNGLDYGSGMAYSFFHGYLNLILPRHNGIKEEAKDLIELMQDYEADHKVAFQLYKIFILIPKSLNCFVSLADCSTCGVEMRSSLGEKRITLAGVRERIYKNSVYTIATKTGPVYVCAEYATPLRTFREAVYASGAHNVYYRKHKNEILLQFYLTLSGILREHSLDNMCELIYYEDVDENGEFHDVGKIILSRLSELKKQKMKYD